MANRALEIYSVEQIRRIENNAIQKAKIGFEDLMSRAAKYCLITLQDNYRTEKSLTLYCGTGNNGGDGLYLALFAKEAGYAVEVVILSSALSEKTQKYVSHIYLKLKEANIVPIVYTAHFVPSGKILVDALLGIGLRGILKPEIHEVIQHINFYAQTKKVFSVDIPSGLDADTGGVADIAVKADITATFIGYKSGLLTGVGPEQAGDIFLDSLNIPEKIFSDIRPFCHEITADEVQSLLPSLQRQSKIAHKHDFGHVVVVAGGEPQFAGAGILAASAALKIGAGLVSLIVPSKSYVRISHAPAELMCYAIDNFNQETAGFLAQAEVLIIGPGLGRTMWSKQALMYVLTLNHKKVLYDADALNLMAKEELGGSLFLKDEQRSIFTPHPGEAAALLNKSSKDIQLDRFNSAKEIASQYETTVVLKGAGSLIYNKENQFTLCAFANAALATAGTGDVLTGIIAGLWAQGLNAYDAARVGVWVHASLAEKESQKIGSRGLVASDLIHATPGYPILVKKMKA